MIYDIVEGTTQTLQFQLLEAGVPIDLTGATVSILIEDRTGTTVASPGTVTVVDAANGRVRFAPTAAGTFTKTSSPYYVRWKIVDAATLIGYVPSSIRDIWNFMGQ